MTPPELSICTSFLARVSGATAARCIPCCSNLERARTRPGLLSAPDRPAASAVAAFEPHLRNRGMPLGMPSVRSCEHGQKIPRDRRDERKPRCLDVVTRYVSSCALCMRIESAHAGP
jgi:hypothetical protein